MAARARALVGAASERIAFYKASSVKWEFLISIWWASERASERAAFKLEINYYLHPSSDDFDLALRPATTRFYVTPGLKEALERFNNRTIYK